MQKSTNNECQVFWGKVILKMLFRSWFRSRCHFSDEKGHWTVSVMCPGKPQKAKSTMLKTKN